MQNLQFAETADSSAWPVLHDGGQPWRVRRQSGVGTCSPQVDHRKGLLHLLAPKANRDPLGRSARRPATRGGSSLPSIAISDAASWRAPTKPAVARLPVL